MLWAVVISIGSVLGGTLLALLPKGRNAWIGPIRTFAFIAALSVVIRHLLPEALASVGAGAIAAFLFGLFAPELLGKLGAYLFQASRGGKENPRDLALEAGYFGLLLHRVGDGLGLGAFTGELSLGHGNSGVLTALAAHVVPVVAIVVLTFDSVRGRGSALIRAAGLAAASIFGAALTQSVPGESLAAATGWISALVGGTLLHVVTHDLGVDLPKSAPSKVWDLLAAALGIYVSFLGQGAHGGHEGAHAVSHFEEALVEFSIETGPLLMLGLVVGALLATLGGRIPASFFRSRGPALDAARGTLIGAPLPLCSCSVLPISASLKARGAAPALVVAFLISTPELGVETFALSVRFLGWEMAWFRLGGALVVAFVTALAVALVLRKTGPSPEEAPPSPTAPSTSTGPSSSSTDFFCPPSTLGAASSPAKEGSFAKRFLAAFDELFQHVGAWMILGMVAAALLEVALPSDALSSLLGVPAQFLVITLVAIPSYVCAPSATPLAAVLLSKGMSPGAVMVGLLLGPATNIATVVFLRRWFGKSATAVGLLVVISVAWALGLLAQGVLDPSAALGGPLPEHGHGHGPAWLGAAALSGALLLRALFKSGARGFLVTVQGEHGHAHGDAGEHGHAHGDAGEHGHAHGDADGGHGHAHGDAGGGHGHAHSSHPRRSSS